MMAYVSNPPTRRNMAAQTISARSEVSYTASAGAERGLKMFATRRTSAASPEYGARNQARADSIVRVDTGNLMSKPFAYELGATAGDMLRPCTSRSWAGCDVQLGSDPTAAWQVIICPARPVNTHNHG